MQKLILCAIILLLSINQARAAKDEPTPATSVYVSLSEPMVLSEQKASDIKSPEKREEIRRSFSFGSMVPNIALTPSKPPPPDSANCKASLVWLIWSLVNFHNSISLSLPATQ